MYEEEEVFEADRTNKVTFTLLLFGLSVARSVSAGVNRDCEGLTVGE